MKKADLKQNHVEFDEALARYRGFMERIIAAQRVVSSSAEKQDVAESVLLRLTAHWERFVDEHLIDCVNADHSQLNEFLGVTIPPNPTKNMCQAVMFGGGYRDFKNFGDLKGFTKRVLPEQSNPFLAVGASDARKIDEVYKIRNYLAHYSTLARRSLNRVYKDQYKLARFQEPGRFLLAGDAKRLWAYFDAFESASKTMRDWVS